MLADQLDYVVGVDPHRDSHALAVVEVVTGAVVFEATSRQTAAATKTRSYSSSGTRAVDAHSRSKAPARSVVD
jgi:hypothetical protein